MRPLTPVRVRCSLTKTGWRATTPAMPKYVAEGTTLAEVLSVVARACVARPGAPDVAGRRIVLDVAMGGPVDASTRRYDAAVAGLAAARRELKRATRAAARELARHGLGVDEVAVVLGVTGPEAARALQIDPARPFVLPLRQPVGRRGFVATSVTLATLDAVVVAVGGSAQNGAAGASVTVPFDLAKAVFWGATPALAGASAKSRAALATAVHAAVATHRALAPEVARG